MHVCPVQAYHWLKNAKIGRIRVLPCVIQAQLKKAGVSEGPVFLSEPCLEPEERLIAVVPRQLAS